MPIRNETEKGFLGIKKNVCLQPEDSELHLTQLCNFGFVATLLRKKKKHIWPQPKP